jgi:hypothetical protein
MAFELDHIFICTSRGGEEANQLATFGLTEGTPNMHPGQGTACRRFFFANFYIELLWVCHAGEAQSETARSTYLWERWERRGGGVCPLGFGFRASIKHDGGVPFSGWEYCPPYLPSPLSIHVATNANMLTEPMLFYLPFARRSDSYPIGKRPPLQHRAGLGEMTRVELVSPHVERLSPEMAAVRATGLVGLRPGAEYLVELGFDGESQGRQQNFRPRLPLVFRW